VTSFDAVREAEDRFQIPTYAHLPVAVATGSGARVTDSEGETWLDFYGGHAVALTGHCHPRVVEAVKAQADRLLFYSNAVYNDARARAVEALVDVAPEGITQVFLCNSGAEANEAALKTARMLTGRTGVVSMDKGFHGRTLGAVSVTGLSKYREYGGPLVPGTTIVPFGNESALREAVGEDTAAVIVEPVPSMGGVHVADVSWYRALRDVCDATGALLIFDEVQTGMGRTGRWWAGDHFDFRPDLHTLAKGIASGVPCGAVMFRTEFAERIGTGDHGTTFGGSPLACAALEATINIVKEEGLVERAAAAGGRIRDGVASMDGVGSVRGLGLLLAIETDAPAKTVLERLREQRVLASSIPGDDTAIRVLPPLVITDDDVDEFLSALGRAAGGTA
jgi:acetylornithine/succinyldiaminopimelate/putrescine aminotransferase